MTLTAKLKLAIKAIYCYAQEHYGFGARYHPEERDKYDALMDVIKLLEKMKENEK